MTDISEPAVTVRSPSSDAWLAGLAEGHPRRDRYLRELHGLLRRAAFHELYRRRTWDRLGDAELDDLAEQAADDALLAVTAKLGEFRGASRFTTWAYKFAVFEVSNQLARRTARDRATAEEEPDWDVIADLGGVSPEREAEQREQFRVLRRAIDERLTAHQRAVFVAVALNEEPMDVVALRLGSNRNAVYKNLFDARRRLRAALADAGHPM